MWKVRFFTARFIGLQRSDVVWVIGVKDIGRRERRQKNRRREEDTARLWSSLKNTSLALCRRATREEILHVHLIEEMRGRKLEGCFKAVLDRLKRLKMRHRRWIPDSGAVFKVRSDKEFAKIDESGRRRWG